MMGLARLLIRSYGRLATGGIFQFARLGLGAPAPDALRLAQRPARVARLPLPSGECCDAIARGGIEASGVADVAVLDGVLDVAGSGDADAHPWIAHTPVQQRLRPGPDAVVG